MAQTPFRLRWSADRWQRVEEADSSGAAAFQIEYADLAGGQDSSAVHFTFFWAGVNRWEGRDFQVTVVPSDGRQTG